MSTGTAVPQTVPASSVPADAPSYDVVVVGFGISGGCAALEAARAGARVLLLEKAAAHGGTSAMSGGHFYLGGGTALQVACGFEDTPDNMYDYLVASSKEPERDKIRAYCDGSVEHFDWLEALGFEFERTYFPGKAVVQPGTEGLSYTGSEKVWPFRDLATPVPRGHKVPVPGDLGGTQLVMDLLRDRLAEAGVEVRYETGATQFVVGDDVGDNGDVVGLAWRCFDETGFVRTPAVVIAAGGFVMNREMVAEHVPAMLEKPFTLGSTHDDGLGIRLGLSVGADLRHMDEPFVTAPFYPPSNLVFGFIVNKQGERFVCEDSYHSRTAQFVLEQTDHAAYLIVDSNHVEYAKYPLVPLVDGYETIEELETALDLPDGSVQKTLERYNELAAAGDDVDFHKHPDWLAPQDAGPWAVFDLTLGKATYAGFTLGGLRVSVDGEVQKADGSIVRGLYAAGACASNLAQDGKGYCSGTQLGEGSFFGRRAGRHAASLAG